MTSSPAWRRNLVRGLAVGIALAAGPASALPVRPATFYESASADVNGVQVDGAVGADDLLPETVSIQGSGTNMLGQPVSWDGTATTSGAPSPRATAQATNVNLSGSLVRGLVTYDVEVVAAPGAPSAPVRVLFSAFGEVETTSPFTTGSVGFISLIVKGVDPATGFTVGPDVWNVRNEDNRSYVLNESTTVFPRAGNILRIQMTASCQTSIGSCSAFIDPLPVIDPTHLIFVDGVDRPATDFFSLAFSSNIPEPASGATAALAIALLLYAPRAQEMRT